MKIFLVSLIILFISYLNVSAADIYVDSVGVDSEFSGECASCSTPSDDDYDLTTRDCGSGSYTVYSTIQAAVTAMSGGDDIYIRNGSYTEYATLTETKNGTSENWSSIQSYPGEWAIIDADAAEHYCLGHSNYDKVRTATGLLEYWKFERLELTGGDDSGLFLSGGPFIVRYIYFHDNLAPSGGANPCAIKGMIWKNSTVEYCYFKNNGSTGEADEQHSAIGIQIHSDYANYIYTDPDVGPEVIANAYQNNIYRYNLFENTDSRAQNGIHDKALQPLTPNSAISWTYEEYGNEIHHNIFVDIEIAIGAQQCFAQIHNNIVWGCEKGIVNSDSGMWRGANAQVVYNNTIYGGRIIANFGAPDDETWDNPYLYIYNNIIDSAPADGWRYDITLGTYSIEVGFNYTASRTHIENNYIYRPSDSNEIDVASEGVYSMSSYDSTYSSSNYSQASTEGTISLYQGASGALQYKINENHLIGATNITEGGVGGNHPYLSGVTLPSYIGATNPDDDDWVDGVLDMDADYFTAQEAGSDPTWLEDSGNTNIGTGVTGAVGAGVTVNISN